MGCTNQPQSSQSTGLSLSRYICPVCNDTTVALGQRAASPDCHGKMMVATEETDRQVSRATLGAQLQEAFDIPRSGTDVCYTLLTDGIQSVASIARRTGHECRTVETHLERLESDGLLDSSTLSREDGGDVTVYHTEREALPTRLTAFCLWATWAAGESVASVALAGADQDPATVFWTTFCEGDDQSVRC